MGDIHGPRQLFLIGLALFTLASLASGMSQSPGQLIAFRAVQGLGAALLAPQGLAMITSILPEAKRGGAFAAIGIMSGLGVLLGPTLGGFIVTHLDWRWIFFLNVPIGIVAFVLAIFYMPDVRPGRRHRLDLTAVALLTVGLLFVVFGLIEGQRYDWGTIVGFVTIPMVIAHRVRLPRDLRLVADQDPGPGAACCRSRSSPTAPTRSWSASCWRWASRWSACSCR